MNYFQKFVGVSFLFLFLFQSVMAEPQLPMSLYGSAYIYNMDADVSTEITVRDVRGNLCASFDTVESGKFGLLNCLSYNSTGDERGALRGEPLSFWINGYPASVIFDDNVSTLNTLTWNSGEFKELTLIRPQLVCGDTFCDSYESCESCPADCGVCDSPGGDSGSDSSDSGSDVDGGSGSDSSGSDGGLSVTPGQVLVPPNEEFFCEEDWLCSDWGPCQNNSLQTRECIDANECGTEDVMPDLTRACTYIEPIDELNDTYEGVEPDVELPLVVKRCSAKMPFFSFPSLIFIFLTFGVILLRFYLNSLYLKKIQKNPDLSDVDIIKKRLVSSHKELLFVVTTLILSIVIYVYHYFFYMCPEFYYNNLFLLVIFVIFFPFLVNIILFLLGSTNKSIKKKLSYLEDSHYRHVLKLLAIVNDKLLKSEEEIVLLFKKMGGESEFKDLLNTFDPLKKVFLDFKKLKGLYKEGKLATSVEKDLLENIKVLQGDDNFHNKSDSIPGLQRLANSLSALYDSYEYKQDLYYEMLKVESSLSSEEFDGNSSDDLLGGGSSGGESGISDSGSGGGENGFSK